METPNELVQQVKELISSNKTGKALQLLAKNQLSAIDKELVILNSRYVKLQEDQTFGVIDEEEVRQEINKINRSLLNLSEKIGKPGEGASALHSFPLKKYGLIAGGIVLLLIGGFAIVKLASKNGIGGDRAPSISYQISGEEMVVTVENAKPPYTLAISKDGRETYSKALPKAGEYTIDLSSYRNEPGEYKLSVADARGYDNVEIFSIETSKDRTLASTPPTHAATTRSESEEESPEPEPATPMTKEDIMAHIWDNMVAIPAGSFTMGCTSPQHDCENDEKPVHQVSLSGFHMNKYEVTQEEWFAVMGNYPSKFSVCSTCPVERVTYHDAQTFIKKLNQQTSKNYRLPTEAEWEYAARGGENLKYAGSQDDIDAVGWYARNENNKTNPVGQKSPNGYGLFDMAGNVWEWCHGWYGTYPVDPQTDPQSYGEGPTRVLRGGSWGNEAEHARVSNRGPIGKDHKNDDCGFRLAHD